MSAAVDLRTLISSGNGADLVHAVAAGYAVWERMGVEGDVKSIWDPNKADEVEAKRREFEYLTKEKRYKAYRVTGADGERGEPMDTFEAAAGRVLFVPPMAGG